jgi:hypothetical protein
VGIEQVSSRAMNLKNKNKPIEGSFYEAHLAVALIDKAIS